MTTRLPAQERPAAQHAPNPPRRAASPYPQPTHYTFPPLDAGLHTPIPTDRFGQPYPETLKGMPMDAQHQTIGCLRAELPLALRKEVDNALLDICSRELQMKVFGHLKMYHVPPAAVKRMIDGEFYRAYPEFRLQEKDERVVMGDVGGEKEDDEMGKTDEVVEEVPGAQSCVGSPSGIGTKRSRDEAEEVDSPAKKAKTDEPDTGSGEDTTKAELQLMANAQKGNASGSEAKAELEFIIENPAKSAPVDKRSENAQAKNAVSKQMNAETDKYEKRLKSKKKRGKVMRFNYTVPEVGTAEWEKINTEPAARGKD